MKLELFLRDQLAIHFYYSDESLCNNTVNVENLYLIFPGLPQFIEKDFFTDKVDKKNAFMYVYYFGSYFSGKIFSFKNCQQTVIRAINFSQAGAGVKTFDNKKIKWKAKNINIIGNSFGTLPILTSKIDKRIINKIFFTSPLIFIYKKDIQEYMSKKEITKFNEFNKKFLNFMSRGYKNIYRGIDKKNWENFFNGDSISTKIDYKNNLPPITIIHGSDDNIVNSKGSIHFNSRYTNQVNLKLVKGVGHEFKLLFRSV